MVRIDDRATARKAGHPDLPASILQSGQRRQEVVMALHRFGAENPNWRGGRRIRPDGYIYVYVGYGHHLANERGYAMEHRVVAEQMLDRKLEPDEIAHHIDGDRQNNEPANLCVMRFGEHMSLHTKQRVWTAESRKRLARSKRGHVVSAKTRAKISASKKASPPRLTVEDVRAIRNELASGTLQRDLASRYGVTDTCICYINRRKTWAHVQ